MDSNTASSTSIKITCNNNNFILNDELIIKLRNVQCNMPPKYSVVRQNNHEICYGNNVEVIVGFQTSSGALLETLRLCFDEGLLTTRYVRHKIQSSVSYFQCCPRPDFRENNMFNDVNRRVNDIYKPVNHRGVINEILGLPYDDVTYIHRSNNDYILSRGHLAAKADFVYTYQQQSTFTFVNILPQFATVNNGNWNSLEINVRDYAARNQKDLVIYTGIKKFSVNFLLITHLIP